MATSQYNLMLNYGSTRRRFFVYTDQGKQYSNIIILRKMINILVIHYKTKLLYYSNHFVLCIFFDVISNEIGVKNIRKKLRSCAGSRNYDKQNTEKVLQLKDVFLVYL